MSSTGSLTTPEYIQAAVKMAEEYDDVIGFVCQRKLCERQDIVYMTPGKNYSAVWGDTHRVCISLNSSFTNFVYL